MKVAEKLFGLTLPIVLMKTPWVAVPLALGSVYGYFTATESAWIIPVVWIGFSIYFGSEMNSSLRILRSEYIQLPIRKLAGQRELFGERLCEWLAQFRHRLLSPVYSPLDVFAYFLRHVFLFTFPEYSKRISLTVRLLQAIFLLTAIAGFSSDPLVATLWLVPLVLMNRWGKLTDPLLKLNKIASQLRQGGLLNLLENNEQSDSSASSFFGERDERYEEALWKKDMAICNLLDSSVFDGIDFGGFGLFKRRLRMIVDPWVGYQVVGYALDEDKFYDFIQKTINEYRTIPLLPDDWREAMMYKDAVRLFVPEVSEAWENGLIRGYRTPEVLE